MNAQENLRMTNDFQGRTIARLTSGYRINQSGDDAAGLAVANKYRSDVSELSQGVRNANDGLSTLQIIDGGLNNISKMLDRLKTLATQSASSTFTGNRDTLNDEYTNLLSEIDRQASNVGLGQSDANAGRYNINIKVYTGGGSSSNGSALSIDLAGSNNLVDSTALNLSGSKISDASKGLDLVTGLTAAKKDYLKGGESQVFHISTVGGTKDITVKGDTDGLALSEVARQLNDGLAGTGVRINVKSDNTGLEVGSKGGFAVTIDAVSGGSDQVSAAVATAKVNTTMYNTAAATLQAPAAAGAAKFTVGSTDFTVNWGGSETKDSVFTKLQTAASSAGIQLVRQGDNVIMQSAQNFTFTDDSAAANAAFTGAVSVTAASGSPLDLDPTKDALSAIEKISAAVTTLGNVQGKIGTAQNKLSYAIQLAQSQITNFSAAESRIRDADVAQEAANLTKAQVLSQASMAALAQANSAPQAVLSLLRG
jgi:flagellin